MNEETRDGDWSGVDYWRNAAVSGRQSVVFNERIMDRVPEGWRPWIDAAPHTGGIVEVRGVGHYQSDVRLACALARRGRVVGIHAVAEPTNPHDGNAVKVVATFRGRRRRTRMRHATLGYLPAEIAAEVQPRVMAGDVDVVPVVFFPIEPGRAIAGLRVILVEGSPERASLTAPEASPQGDRGLTYAELYGALDRAMEAWQANREDVITVGRVRAIERELVQLRSELQEQREPDVLSAVRANVPGPVVASIVGRVAPIMQRRLEGYSDPESMSWDALDPDTTALVDELSELLVDVTYSLDDVGRVSAAVSIAVDPDRMERRLLATFEPWAAWTDDWPRRFASILSMQWARAVRLLMTPESLPDGRLGACASEDH